jgi:hypothetical protein
LTATEQVIYLQLYRLTWGYGRARCQIGFPKLAERAGVGETTARVAAKGLIRKGLVRKVSLVLGKNIDQGIEWEVFEPPASRFHRAAKSDGLADLAGPADSEGPAKSAPMKEKQHMKENTQTHAVVGVGSRFSLEECRRYAEYLQKTGQGITNPGGYATKIFRSGESDELIDAWLSPPASPDISKCPDCEGRGFVYPNGFEAGQVIRCKHERLQNA